MIEILGGRRKLEKIYQKAIDEQAEGAIFWDAAARALGLKSIYDYNQLQKIPSEGPLVIVANHPYGIVDGVLLCQLVSQVRPDFKILMHSTLCREPSIERNVLPVDFRETKRALKVNIESKKKTIEALKSGEAVLIFPGGGVSTAPTPLGRAIDLEWKMFPARLIQQAQAATLPVFVSGQNSRAFQVVSQFSETLRSSLYVREIRKKMGTTIPINIGDPIQYEEVQHVTNRMELTNRLREITYQLGEQLAA